MVVGLLGALLLAWLVGCVAENLWLGCWLACWLAGCLLPEPLLLDRRQLGGWLAGLLGSVLQDPLFWTQRPRPSQARKPGTTALTQPAANQELTFLIAMQWHSWRVLSRESIQKKNSIQRPVLTWADSLRLDLTFRFQQQH